MSLQGLPVSESGGDVLENDATESEGRGSGFFGESNDLPLEQESVLFPTFFWHHGKAQMLEV